MMTMALFSRLAQLHLGVATALVFGLATLTTPANAAERTYNPFLPGCFTTDFFDVSSCWSGGFLPGEADTALFTSAGTYTVYWDGSTLSNWQAATGSSAAVVSNGPLTVQNGNATFQSFNTTPREYRILGDVNVNTNGVVTLGGVGAPFVLDVADNSVVDGSFTVSLVDTGGTINVIGTGSALQSPFVTVGGSGSGTLNILSGGRVSGNGAGVIGDGLTGSGIVSVDGTGSIWNPSQLLVGARGNGILNITNGGSVGTSGGGFIGRSEGSTGTVTVDGAGSSLTDSGGFFAVGWSGTGTLDILRGGSVSNALGIIGSQSTGDGTVTVAGTGSTWTNSSDLVVGAEGNGELIILSGGSVSNTGGIIGSSLNSLGTATVFGTDSTWTSSGNLAVGREGRRCEF